MCMLCLDTSLKAIHNVAAALMCGCEMYMLYLDTSLKAIHNPLAYFSIVAINVYAMLRYKFESNSESQRTQLQMYE